MRTPHGVERTENTLNEAYFSNARNYIYTGQPRNLCISENMNTAEAQLKLGCGVFVC